MDPFILELAFKGRPRHEIGSLSPREILGLAILEATPRELAQISAWAFSGWFVLGVVFLWWIDAAFQVLVADTFTGFVYVLGALFFTIVPPWVKLRLAGVIQ
ncbi:MAG: hypothetical protein HZA67_12010 [Rhodospirillales bacterium]|nr:hypothetical protein [Rhodospirillales bacterium]